MAGKRVSLNRAIWLLAKNNIEVDENECVLMLNFLYHIATSYKNSVMINKKQTLTKHRTTEKLP